MKKVYISIDENDRVLEWSSTFSDGYIDIEVEEDHELLLNPFIFKYVDGFLIKDTEFQEKLIEDKKGSEDRNPINLVLEQSSNLALELANTQKILNETQGELQEAKLLNNALAQQQAGLLLLFAKGNESELPTTPPENNDPPPQEEDSPPSEDEEPLPPEQSNTDEEGDN